MSLRVWREGDDEGSQEGATRLTQSRLPADSLVTLFLDTLVCYLRAPGILNRRISCCQSCGDSGIMRPFLCGGASSVFRAKNTLTDHVNSI
jgi:hypothetical protein